MAESNSCWTVLQPLLARVASGDEAAVDALLRHCRERLLALTRRMLGDYRRVRRWADTEDVLHNALLRLLRTLRDVKPATPRDFLALATVQIRRELIDLARHYYGPEGMGAHHDSAAPDEAQARGVGARPQSGEDPAALAQWRELHEQIGTLPDEEREVVGLLFYQGLSQPEAAELLGISLRTVQRRWHTALCKLHRVWVSD
jgi:RNA polymerase sigma factor (sigma-70 family)